jgi:hypothetical protein
LRYPVWYTSLEALGIDVDELPPFTPLSRRAAVAGGMGEMPARPVIAPANWTQPDARNAIVTDDPDAWRRLDAILAQLDRVPDLPAPVDALEWDEHGLPR